ncbi:MAG: hypothetical protein V3T72_16440 [Thermoanaerobaculia bacterium]
MWNRCLVVALLLLSGWSAAAATGGADEVRLVLQIRPRVVHRPVAPTGIASTLAAYLGFKAPSGALGDVLVEVLGD